MSCWKEGNDERLSEVQSSSGAGRRTLSFLSIEGRPRGEGRVPVDALGPIWLAATCPPADKKEVDEEKRQYIASALTAISGRNCLDQCPIAVLEL